MPARFIAHYSGASDKNFSDKRLKQLPKHTWFYVFLIVGISLTILGIAKYLVANLSTEYTIPKGSINVGIGPTGNMTPISTKIVFTPSVPYSKMRLEVFFKFSEFKKYHIHITMPYLTKEAKAYLRYLDYSYSPEIPATSELGSISCDFKNFTKKGSSAINATFIPNINYPFVEPVAISIEATLRNLVSINYPLGSKQTVILTFFGGQGTIWDDEFIQFTGLNKLEMADYPFEVIIRFPQENYLSTDTFPTPMTSYVTEGFRSAIFSLNFSYTYPEWRGQSISCSYNNPNEETKRNLFTFISGTFIAIGITALFESLKKARELLKKKTNQEEKPQEKEPKDGEDNEEKQRQKYCNSPLLLEYQMAQEMHNYYGKISWEISSIFVAGSVALIGLSFQSAFTKEIFPFVALIVTIIMVSLYFLFNRIAQLVEIHVARLNVIEETLHFHQHRLVHEAHKEGHVNIRGKCYDLSGPRARDTVKFLIVALIVFVWLTALSLFIV